MNKNIRIEDNKVFLCCGKTRCPSIVKDESSIDSYIVTDDYKGSVKLTKDQLEAVREALSYLEELPEANQVDLKEK